MISTEWYQPDNVSKVFLAVHNKKDTRTLRVSAALTEDIDEKLLQEALLTTIKIRPQFQVRIRRGVFWHYIDPTNELPVVKKEHERPCPVLYGEYYKGVLHYSVTYYKNRINFDVFHVLTDGSGALEFLNILVLEYLKLRYPGKLTNISVDSGASPEDLNENSFAQFYEKKPAKAARLPKAYKLSGMKLPYDQLHFYELHLDGEKVIKMAKEQGASLTSFLAARLMLSIYKGMPTRMKNKSITMGIPVNLRNYYPSKTIRNFFNTVFVSHKFEGDEDLTQLSKRIDAELKDNLTPEKIRGRMDSFQKLEEMLLVRPIPLVLKMKVIKHIAKAESKKVTATISNLGIRKIPEEMARYIESYSAHCATEDFFMTVSSYGNDLVLGISTPFSNTRVLSNFIRSFTSEGVEATLYASEVVK